MKNFDQRLRRKMPTEYLPETIQFFNRIAARGGAISNNSMTVADTFVRRLRETGLWPKVLELGLFVGSDLTAALVKLKCPEGGQGYLANTGFVAADYVETGANGGLLGDGATKVLRTGTAQAILGATGHLSFYLREDLTGSAAQTLLGAEQGSQVFAIAKADNETDTLFCYGGGITLTTADLTRGFFCGVRAGPTDAQFYKDGVLLQAEPTPATVVDTTADFALWAASDGSAVSQFLDKRGCFYSLGQVLTGAEVALFSALVQELQAALNRAV